MRIGLCALALLGCGRVAHDERSSGASGSSGSAGAENTVSESGAGGETGGADTSAAGAEDDPGSVRMRLLTSAQYHNSVVDLLGVDLAPPAVENTYPSDEAQIGDLAPYLDVATQVTEKAFAAPALPALLSCAVGSNDRDCALGVIAGLGSRVYRRPLLPEQTAAFVKLYDSVIAAGDTPTVALKQVVRGLLVSLQFLYRVEFTTGSDENAPYPLDSYAMAARLSYLLWDTTPDAELVVAAAKDQLQTTAGLDDQFDRLAAASHSRDLGLALGSSWLGLDALTDLGTPLALSLRQEAGLYLGAFFDDGTPFDGVLTRDVNYVDGVLAPYYDPSPWVEGFAPVVITTDHRSGLLGLGGVMLAMSYPDRVSISRRGAYVQARVLCHQGFAAPPSHAVAPTRKRADLEAATSAGECRTCHQLIDPIGYGLDHFDQLGDYAITYPDSSPIDASGALASGATFDGEIALSQALSHEADFAPCVAAQLTEYALGRALRVEDARSVGALGRKIASDLSLRDALEAQTHLPAFRKRRPTTE